MDRREHLAVLTQHPFDDISRSELVDSERARVDGLGEKALPFRTSSHASTGPQESAADTIIVVPCWTRISITCAPSAGWRITRSRATRVTWVRWQHSPTERAVVWTHSTSRPSKRSYVN